jgi:hypothetical protein
MTRRRKNAEDLPEGNDLPSTEAAASPSAEEPNPPTMTATDGWGDEPAGPADETASNDHADAGEQTVEPVHSAIPGAVRLAVYVAGFALLGIGVGMGYSLLSSPGPAAETPAAVADAVPIDSRVGDNKALSSEDPLREWNIRSAAYVSPLISQLARQPRETLGGQVLLCREQRSTLQGVLDLETPPGDDVGAAFDRWRSSLQDVLDRCISTDPTGDDQVDIKRIVAEVQKTETLFADFLRLQRPIVDVTYDANPDMFE